MVAKVILVDPVTGLAATVSEFGQLVVSPVDYSSITQATVNVVDTAFNLLTPTSGQQIVVTGIILTASRTVGVNDATIDLYLADGPEETVFSPEDAVLALELEKNGKLVMTPINLITEVGKWINVKADDTEISVTLMYYRVPVK